MRNTMIIRNDPQNPFKTRVPKYDFKRIACPLI